MLDEPLTIGDWTPRNSDGRYRGPISLREAFAISSNVAAVRLSERVGRDNVIRAARDLGIRSPLHSEPSMALGTSGVSLIEMVSAYAGVASGKYPVRPRGLPGGRGGRLVHLGALALAAVQRAIDLADDARPAVGAVNRWHRPRRRACAVETFGKTGTTQDNRDALFIGFAGDLVTGVWIGNDDNSPLRGVEGGGLPARIWRDFMSSAVAGAVGARRARAAAAARPRRCPTPRSRFRSTAPATMSECRRRGWRRHLGRPQWRAPPLPVDIPTLEVPPPPPSEEDEAGPAPEFEEEL